MAIELTVSKLISKFGFEVDKTSLKKAEATVEQFKKKLKNIEAKVTVKADRAAQRRKSKQQEEHYKKKYNDEKKFRRKEEELAQKALGQRLKEFKKLKREEEKISRASMIKRVKDSTISKGIREGRGRAFRSSFEERVGVSRSFTSMNMSDYYRGLEKQSALQQAMAAKDAKAAGMVGPDRRTLERAQERYNQSQAKEEVRRFREQVDHANTMIRLNRRTNDLERIRAEYDKEELIAQRKLNQGLIDQLQYEQRINAAIARRDRATSRFHESLNRPSGGGASGRLIGAAEGAGLLGGMRGMAQGLVPALAAGGAAFGSVFAVRELFSGTMKLEQFNLAMRAVLGSTDAAQKELEFFRKTALATGVGLTSGIDSYKSFASAMVTSNMSIEQTRDTFREMARATMVYGLTQDQVNGTLRAFGQIASKGQLYAEELRQQLGERLYGAVALTAQGLGITVQELNQQMEAGEINAQRFFPAITQALREMNDAAGDVSNTMPFLWRRLLNVFQNITVVLHQMGSSEAFKNTLQNVIDFAEGFSMVLVPVLHLTIHALEWISNILGTKAGGFIAALAGTLIAVNLLAGGMKKLFALMMLSKIGAFIKALTLAATVAYSAGGAIGVLNVALATTLARMRSIAVVTLAVSKVMLPLLLLADELEGIFTGRQTVIDEYVRDPTKKVLKDKAGLSEENSNILGTMLTGNIFDVAKMGVESWKRMLGFDTETVKGNMSSMGSKIPNGPVFGTGNTINNNTEIRVDARGSTDPAATEAAARRGVNGAFDYQLKSSTMSTPGG